MEGGEVRQRRRLTAKAGAALREEIVEPEGMQANMRKGGLRKFIPLGDVDCWGHEGDAVLNERHALSLVLEHAGDILSGAKADRAKINHLTRLPETSQRMNERIGGAADRRGWVQFFED